MTAAIARFASTPWHAPVSRRWNTDHTDDPRPGGDTFLVTRQTVATYTESVAGREGA